MCGEGYTGVAESFVVISKSKNDGKQLIVLVLIHHIPGVQSCMLFKEVAYLNLLPRSSIVCNGCICNYHSMIGQRTHNRSKQGLINLSEDPPS